MNKKKLSLVLIASTFLILIVAVYAATFTIAPHSKACNLADNDPQGTFPDACGVANGSNLMFDDGSSELGRYIAPSSYAGANATYRDTTITNCTAVQQVDLCYEWWYQAAAPGGDCHIAVDNAAGASPTNVTNTCPGGSANPGVNCTDVTALESWDCNDFFNSSFLNAYAEAEMNGGGSLGAAIIDVLYFNVTYTDVPVMPPVVTITAPANNTQTTDNTPTITFTSEDPDNTTSSCTLYFNGVNESFNATVFNGTKTNLTTSPLADNNYTYRVDCFDGMAIGSSPEYSMLIDTTPPLNPLTAFEVATGTTWITWNWTCPFMGSWHTPYAVQDTSDGGFTQDNTIDNNLSSFWVGGSNIRHWIAFQLNGAGQVNGTRIYTNNTTYYLCEVDVYVSKDDVYSPGEKVANQINFTAGEKWNYINFTNVSGAYVNVSFNTGKTGACGVQPMVDNIFNEFDAYFIPDLDINHTEVWYNDTFWANNSCTNRSTNITGLTPGTLYEIQLYNVDDLGNVNTTGTNDTASTDAPPADADGDGYNSTAEGGNDCDDNNASIIPLNNSSTNYINRSVVICSGSYEQVEVILNSSNILVDFNNSDTYGNRGDAFFGYPMVKVNDLTNITLTNMNASGYNPLISGNNLSNSTFHNNLFRNNKDNGIQHMIQLDNLTDFLLLNNTFYNMTDIAPSVGAFFRFNDTVENITITGNIFNLTSEFVFYTFSWGFTENHNNILIDNNTMYDVEGIGDIWSPSQNLNFTNNYITCPDATYDCNGMGPYNATTWLINNNNVYNGGLLSGGHVYNTNIENNTITNQSVNYVKPIDAQGSNITIRGNIISGNNFSTAAAIEASTSETRQSYIALNLVENNNVTLWSSISAGYGLYLNGTGYTIARNNNFDTVYIGLYTNGNFNYTVHDNNFTGITYRPLQTSGDTSAIYDNYFEGGTDVMMTVTNADDTNITDNVFNTTSATRFLTLSSSDRIILNNTMLGDIVQYGIVVSGDCDENILEGFNVEGLTRNGIRITGGSNNTFRNMVINNTSWDGIYNGGDDNVFQNITIDDTNGTGIFMQNTTNKSYVDNVTIKNVDSEGIYFHFLSSDITVVNSIIYNFSRDNNNDNGLGGHGVSSNAYIANNTIYDGLGNFSECIYVGEESNITVEDNEVYDCRYGIFLPEASGDPTPVNVTNNLVHDTTSDGIACELCNALIDGNEVNDAGGNGIRIAETGITNATNNAVVNASNAALFVIDAGGNNITDNNLSESTDGIRVQGTFTLFIQGNRMFNNEQGILLNATARYITVTGNYIYNNSGAGSNVTTTGTNTHNLFYNNNYSNNTINGWDENVYATSNVATNYSLGAPINGTTNIIGGPNLGGNYWTDYPGVDTNADGFGDTFIPWNGTGIVDGNKDKYPLTNITNDPPVVFLATANNTSTTDTTPGITFWFVDNESTSATCSLIMDGTNVTFGVFSNNTNSTLISTTLTNGTHIYWINCSDGISTAVSATHYIFIQVTAKDIGGLPVSIWLTMMLLAIFTFVAGFIYSDEMENIFVLMVSVPLLLTTGISSFNIFLLGTTTSGGGAIVGESLGYPSVGITFLALTILAIILITLRILENLNMED